jgi:preprotein translocase subunit YajC
MGEGISSFLPLIAIIAVFYFLMIAPQMKRAKKEKKFANELKKGDKVVTKSGMHGKIVDLNDKDSSCVIETLAGKIKFERSAISMEMSQKLNVSS